MGNNKPKLTKMIALYEHRLEAVQTIIHLPTAQEADIKINRLLAGLRARLNTMYNRVNQ